MTQTTAKTRVNESADSKTTGMLSESVHIPLSVRCSLVRWPVRSSLACSFCSSSGAPAGRSRPALTGSHPQRSRASRPRPPRRPTRTPRARSSVCRANPEIEVRQHAMIPTPEQVKAASTRPRRPTGCRVHRSDRLQPVLGGAGRVTYASGGWSGLAFALGGVLGARGAGAVGSV